MWCRSLCLLIFLGVAWFASGHHLFDMKRIKDEIRPCIWIVVHGPPPPPPTHQGPTTTLAVGNGNSSKMCIIAKFHIGGYQRLYKES
nr:unnamed protein product [Callosobruchus analis]